MVVTLQPVLGLLNLPYHCIMFSILHMTNWFGTLDTRHMDIRSSLVAVIIFTPIGSIKASVVFQKELKVSTTALGLAIRPRQFLLPWEWPWLLNTKVKKIAKQ